MSKNNPIGTHELTDIEFDRVDLVDEGANSEAFIKLYKNKGGKSMSKVSEILKTLKEEDAKIIETELNKAKEMPKEDDKDKKISNLQAEIARYKKEAPKDINKSKESEEKELMKGASPELKAYLEKRNKEMEETKLEIKKMKEREFEKEAVSKAKTVTNIAVKNSVLADIYKRCMATEDDKLAEDVFEVFKTADKVIKEGSELFKEKGSTEGNVDNTAWGKVESQAVELAKSKSISKEQAITEVLQSDPELYAQYQKEGM